MSEHLHQHVHAALRQLAPGRPCGVFGTGTPGDPFRVVFSDAEPPPDGLQDAIAAAEAAWRADALSRAKLRARRSLAIAAEAQRQLYITPGPGKALVYEAKLREAQAITAVLAAGGAPVAEQHPFASARAHLLEVTLADVANEWIACQAAWAAIGAGIEAACEAAAAAIDAADTPEAVGAAAASVIWPTSP